MLYFFDVLFHVFMSKVPRYIAIKYMCEILYKRSKESNVEGVKDTLYRFQCIVGDVGDGVCGFYATLYAEYRFHVGDVEDTLYSVYSGPLPRQEGRLIVAIPSVLWV